MEAVLNLLGGYWKILGRPRVMQFDNAREIVGGGQAAGYLARVLRLGLRFEVEPMLIPPAKPECQGSIVNFNGWLQARRTPFHTGECAALGTAAVAGGGQHTARSCAAGRIDCGPCPWQLDASRTSGTIASRL
jgi:hypothetical protein